MKQGNKDMTKGKHSNLQSYLTCGGTHLSKARPN